MAEYLSPEQVNDPTDMLQDNLEYVWEELCRTYDLHHSLPDMQTLFDGIDLKSEAQSSQMILANMLLEVIEEVDRFSPWYKMPARAFGLVSVRDQVTDCIRWILAPEGVQRWHRWLDFLTATVHRNRPLIQAILLVDQLWDEEPVDDPCIDAYCRCKPPRTIRIHRSVLEHAHILCDMCQENFST